MNGLEKAITTLRANASSRHSTAVDARMQLIVTLGFIVAVISVPMLDPGHLVWFFCFPIFMSEATRIGYGRVFMRSLWVLPLIVLIGIFNPLLDRTPLWEVGAVTVSRGWVSFISIVLRGLLSVQALIVLVGACGFNDVCRALSRLGVPSILVAQLMMLYRFLTVMLEEALTMHRARQARGFGRRNYPLRMWGTFAGQLLMRSVNRASCISRAMLARGYNGYSLPTASPRSLRLTDWIYLATWVAVIILLRFVDLSAIFARLIDLHIT